MTVGVKRKENVSIFFRKYFSCKGVEKFKESFVEFYYGHRSENFRSKNVYQDIF